MNHRLEDSLEFALRIAREAGASTLESFQAPDLVVRDKADGTPVTEADARAERILRARIESMYPDDAILGEEEGERPGTSGRRWILDPIDGTVSFLHGVPLYGTLVGLEQEGEAVLGVCHMPALGETVVGARGLGARWYRRGLEPAPARVSSVSELSQAVLLATIFPHEDAKGPHGLGKGLEKLIGRVAHTRGWSDCYAHLLVATGRAEIVFEPAMNVWDCAPFAPILEEAGGSFTDLEGKRTIHGGNALTTNGLLLEEILGALRA